jgi:hypothetical protein
MKRLIRIWKKLAWLYTWCLGYKLALIRPCSYQSQHKSIGIVIVSMLVSSAVDLGFGSWLDTHICFHEKPYFVSTCQSTNDQRFDITEYLSYVRYTKFMITTKRSQFLFMLSKKYRITVMKVVVTDVNS